jgi:hypothetical protein
MNGPREPFVREKKGELVLRVFAVAYTKPYKFLASDLASLLFALPKDIEFQQGIQVR